MQLLLAPRGMFIPELIPIAGILGLIRVTDMEGVSLRSEEAQSL